jgi:ribosomal protein L11 methyltransferase
MSFEISIEGPLSAISSLSRQLKGLSWKFKTIPKATDNEKGRQSLLLLEVEEELLDDKLLCISRIIREIETSLSPRASFDIRVRNLSYSEPPIGDGQFERSFHPIPSLTVQPWSPSVPMPMDGRTIILDPKHAFGTGRHPTTQLCLRIMDNITSDSTLFKGLPIQEVLDFGCGTGLLAIAAIRMGAQRAIGVEIDPQSVRAARRNVKLNGLSNRIDIREGSWEVVKEKYELVLSNLVPAALMRIGRHIPGWVKEGGRAIVSGFGENQLDEMRGFFASLGFIVSQDFLLDKWGALFINWKG